MLVLKRSEVAKPGVNVVLVVSLERDGDQVALATEFAGEAVLGAVKSAGFDGRQHADLLAHHYEGRSRRASRAEPLAC